ncbi:hypothetical protein QQP08_021342 [Theobroma cacao]|nr:hypothetical protein QQP08_021342 [Theobroma cacao]
MGFWYGILSPKSRDAYISSNFFQDESKEKKVRRYMDDFVFSGNRSRLLLRGFITSQTLQFAVCSIPWKYHNVLLLRINEIV